MNEQMSEKMRDSEGEAENNMLLHRRLSEADREIEDLQTRLQNLSLEKQHLQNIIDTQIVSCVTRSCGTSPILDPAHGASLKVVVGRCLRERDLAKGDVHRLEEERDALRERLKVATEIQVMEHARLEKTIMDSEDRVRRLEMERRELMSSAGVQNATINKLEEELGAYRDKYQSVVNELTQQRSLYTQIQSLQEQTDLALANSQGRISQLETELSNAQERIRNLESDRASLDKELSSLRSEHSVLRGSLAKVDQEKDSLLLSIDSKTEEVVRLEQRSKMSDKKILDLEGTVVELRKKLECSMDELATQEEVARSAEREAKELRMEFQALERTRDGLIRENRRLQDELSSATKDVRQANANLHSAREEVETLKRQLQEYVSEIRRVEELLAAKENERSEMLEHFRGLTVEATMLETNNHSLESEAQETKHQLSMANERIQDLEQQLDIRDNLVQSYESQIQELTCSIAKLETQLQQFMGNRQKADDDLEELRTLCMKLDSQKDSLQQQINQQDLMKMQLESEMSQLQERQAHMEEHLGRDSTNIASLESMLASSRSETVAQRRANEELKGEVKQLQQKVDCLQAKLESESAELERYQYQANEYRRQIKDLQREITNERFEKARAADEAKRHRDSCCPTPPDRASPQKDPNSSPKVHRGSSISNQYSPNAKLKSFEWDQKAMTPRGCSPPRASSGGDPPCFKRKQPQYLTPPPSTDWEGLKAALDREASTYTTEPGSPRQGLCNKSSCPFIPRTRPTYVTGPRPLLPSDNTPPEGSVHLHLKAPYFLNGSQGSFSNALDSDPNYEEVPSRLTSRIHYNTTPEGTSTTDCPFSYLTQDYPQ